MSGFQPQPSVVADIPDTVRACLRGKPMPRPIGLSHSADCDSTDYDHMCDECRVEADRDWIIPEGADQ